VLTQPLDMVQVCEQSLKYGLAEDFGRFVQLCE
jgi:hypothetical protein